MASGALADVVEPDLRRRPALDAGPVPRAGRPVHRIPDRAGPGAGLPGDLGAEPGPAAGGHRAGAPRPRPGREGRPGRRRRAGRGDGRRGQLGHRLGPARADRGGHDAGPDGRRAAVVRPCADGDPGRSRPDRPAGAAPDQQGRHARRPGPARRCVHRCPAGRATGQPGRHHGPPHPGAELPRPVVLRHRPVGRCPGRGGPGPGHGQGSRRGLLRSRRRGRDLLPPRRHRHGTGSPGCGRPARKADREPGRQHPRAGSQPGL